MKGIELLVNILNEQETPCLELPFNGQNNLRALITGASGIIGLSIYKFLISSTEYKEGRLSIDCVCKETNEFNKLYFSGERVKLIKSNLPERNYKNFSDRYDLIMNCAGYGQPGKFLNDFENIFSINTLVVSDLLKKLNYNGYFLNIGTSEVYSEASYELTKESSLISINPNNIRNTYILAKLAAESILSKYSFDNPSARTLSARVALAYGPGAKNGDTRVMYHFFRQAALKKSIELLDEGSAVRTYIFVSDCVQLILRALFDRKIAPKIINVAGDMQVTILELAEKIANLYGARVVKGPVNKGLKNAPKEVKLDIESSLVFRDQSLINIDDGLILVKKWIDSELIYENIR
jgi:nucleoside-diphosphate-sugar epimerase